MAIAELKERLRAKFTRRNSISTSETSLTSLTQRAHSVRSLFSRGSLQASSQPHTDLVLKGDDDADFGGDLQGKLEAVGQKDGASESLNVHSFEQLSPSTTTSPTVDTTAVQLPTTSLQVNYAQDNHDSTSTAGFPTPRTDTDIVEEHPSEEERAEKEGAHDAELEYTPAPHINPPPISLAPASPQEDEEETREKEEEEEVEEENEAASATADPLSTEPILLQAPVPAPAPRRPVPVLPRRQSIIPPQQTKLIKTLLETEIPPPSRAGNLDYFLGNGPSTISANMVSRKIWVRRPGASATLVTINEDDLVDDVRDMILKKYANSLGRSFDSPDVTLRICPREQQRERPLGPEEPMGRTLDAYYPGGQSVDEALIIDVPLRRTPKPSPRPGPHMVSYYTDDSRPMEAGTDYFPPMPAAPVVPSPHLPHSVTAPAVPQIHHNAGPPSHAMSVLTTGHVPNLPSPGGRRHHRPRPAIGRTHTSSPTVINGHVQTPLPNPNGTHHPLARTSRSRTHSSASETSAPAPAAPPLLPTPPAPETQIQRAATPPPQVASPRPGPRKGKSKKKSDHPSLPAGLLNGAVPPINVLIVEDNIINLKLLEAFMKRLKVRWQTAMNGREAVTKWRAGGFHLVLMDIQLPVMSGLEATREIRRLERLNSIGVFSSSASSSAPERAAGEEPEGEDKLPSTLLFKSPVIIVALTASSLQSDRHEALAAGCNDFLTKPVNFVWLERKVMEWGCMQALIDFDGWRKWKDFSQLNAETEAAKKTTAAAKKKKRMSMGSNGGTVTAGAVTRRIDEEAEAGTGVAA